MTKKLAFFVFAMFAFATAQAQVGYQVSLLNTATGEPRANVTVNAQVTITDSQNKTIYNGTQKATSNDFGVLSLTVGDANTFAEAGTSKWPLFISVTVDGTLIGKSQILSVPVAEVANSLKSSFTKEDLIGTWVCYIDYDDLKGLPEEKYIFKEYGEVENIYYSYFSGAPGEVLEVEEYIYKGEYEIVGNNIYLFIKGGYDSGEDIQMTVLYWYKSNLYADFNQRYFKE